MSSDLSSFYLTQRSRTMTRFTIAWASITTLVFFAGKFAVEYMAALMYVSMH